MAFEVELGEKKLVFSAPVNDATKKWGVYCIPRLWKEPTGKLVVRLNGEVDSADPETRDAAPTLYFIIGNYNILLYSCDIKNKI